MFCFCLITLISCDRELTFDFYVTNAYSEEIEVKFENNNNNNEKFTLVIEPDTTNRVYTQIEYGSKIGNGTHNLEDLFKYFTIKTDTKESNLDYRTNNLWVYSKLSEISAEYRLIIDSTDFK